MCVIKSLVITFGFWNSVCLKVSDGYFREVCLRLIIIRVIFPSCMVRDSTRIPLILYSVIQARCVCTKFWRTKPWFLCSMDLVGWEKLECRLWISLTFLWAIFSHGVHQLPNYLSEYMVVAYQKMQNDERVLKIYITIISIYENREINAKNRENAPREAINWPTTWISGS